MSLIQDALKRKEEDPGQLLEMPPSSSRTTGWRKKWIFLVGILLFLTASNTIVLVHQLVSRKNEPAPVPVFESISTPKPQNMVWPELICSGLAGEVDDLAVVINGKTLFVGDRIENVKILKILKTMVLLEFRGEKRVLRM